MLIRRLVDWLNLADLDRERESAATAVVARYIRGNVVAQNGWIIGDDEMCTLSKAGDHAMDVLRSACK